MERKTADDLVRKMVEMMAAKRGMRMAWSMVKWMAERTAAETVKNSASHLVLKRVGWLVEQWA